MRIEEGLTWIWQKQDGQGHDESLDTSQGCPMAPRKCWHGRATRIAASAGRAPGENPRRAPSQSQPQEIPRSATLLTHRPVVHNLYHRVPTVLQEVSPLCHSLFLPPFWNLLSNLSLGYLLIPNHFSSSIFPFIYFFAINLFSAVSFSFHRLQFLQIFVFLFFSKMF